MGLITGLVGMAGGLGGFYLASSLGVSKQMTGSYQAGLLIFAGLALIALLGLSLVRKRWTQWSAPAMAQA
jgi:NNP family nitrate/nitrite transporter-like MFS transporter